MANTFSAGHALLIGVGADLPGTVQDAKGIAEVLTDPARCAYPPEQVRLLTGPDATRDNILAALDALPLSTNSQSTVLFYFSGHGYRVTSPTGEAFYLLPYGYDLQKLYKTAVSGAELTARLRALEARKVLVLLDCCHAGGVGEAKAPGLELAKAPLPDEALALLEEGRGVVLIASSQEDELSYAGRPYSAFTLALLEALSGVGVAKKDGWVRVADLALHAREVVPGRTKGKQHPILHFEHADNFAVAYYAGGETEPKGLPFDAEAVEIEPEPGAWRGQQMSVAPVLSGTFHGPVTVEGGRQIDQGGAGVAFAGDVSGGEVHIGDRVTHIYYDRPPEEIAPQPSQAANRLHRILIQRLSWEPDFGNLCFELGIDTHSLPGETFDSKARELVMRFDKRGQLGEIVKVLRGWLANDPQWRRFGDALRRDLDELGIG